MNCGEFSKFLYTFETQFGKARGARSQVFPLLSNKKNGKKILV
jgi:hypothetical protein